MGPQVLVDGSKEIWLTNRCSCRLKLRAESGAYALVITSATWLRAAAQLNSMLARFRTAEYARTGYLAP